MSISSWRVWSLFPQFGIAYLLSLAVLVLFILWIWVDRSFRWVPWIVGQDLHLRFLSDADLRTMHQWDIHGVRMLVFLILAALGLVSTITVFARLFVGDETGRTIRAMMFATALLAFWLSLFVSYDRLWWFAFRYHILDHHDAMKASVTLLSEQWPAERIVLPGLGSYVPSGRDPDLLYIDGPGPNGLTDFRESFDRISRSKKGDISFAVGSYPQWWVHHLEEGRVPQSRTLNVMGTPFLRQLQQVVELGDGWYLAYYEIKDVTSSSDSANNDQPQSPPSADQPGG
jgi:hypothetical protein